MEFTAKEISDLIGGVVQGDELTLVNTINDIESATSGSITFLSNSKYEKYLANTKASVVIVADALIVNTKIRPTLIRVDDPYLGFTTLLEQYKKLNSLTKAGIEQPVFLGDGVQYGKNCYIGAFCHLGNGAKIGDNTKIYPNCVIGDHSTIGDNTTIYSGVNVYQNTVIGNYCTLHSGSVIGSDGFGFAPQQDGSYQAIPQIGNVILEDHVSVGANTVVDNATFQSTVIKRGVKLDNLIQIAHNVEIGEDTIIAAQAGISGSSKIGKKCVIGGQAGIVGHIHIADQSQIQAQSGVTKSTKIRQAVYGSPALNYQNYIKSYSVFRRLPETLKRIELLEEKILTLAAAKNDG